MAHYDKGKLLIISYVLFFPLYDYFYIESSVEQEIFRRHYSKLYDYLSSSDSEVISLTISLYSEDIIGKPIKDRIHTSKGTSAGDKACILLDSVESAITTHPKNFQTFCSILGKISDNLKLSDEIISEYGEILLIILYLLNNDILDARQKPRVNKYESCSEVLPSSNKSEVTIDHAHIYIKYRRNPGRMEPAFKKINSN